MLYISITADIFLNANVGTSDFNSGATTVTFDATDVTKSSNITVYKDNLVENNEIFDIVLS